MHRRRRTALTVLAATLVAAPLLSACGSPGPPGAAAVVGGERIEVSAVQERAAEVRAAQESSPQAGPAGEQVGPAQPREAARADLRPDPRPCRRGRGRHGLPQGDPGDAAGRPRPAGRRGAVRGDDAPAALGGPDQIDADMRQEVQLPKLARALGADLGTPAGQEVVGEALTKASKALDIDVNPRFGTWDDQKMQLGNYSAPWITQRTKFTPEQPTEASTGGQGAGSLPEVGSQGERRSPRRLRRDPRRPRPHRPAHRQPPGRARPAVLAGLADPARRRPRPVRGPWTSRSCPTSARRAYTSNTPRPPRTNWSRTARAAGRSSS